MEALRDCRAHACGNHYLGCLGIPLSPGEYDNVRKAAKIFQKLGEAHGSSCDFTRLSFPAPQAGHVVVGAQ